MIRLEHLTKQFGSRRAVDDLSLEIPAGRIFGLLGHNGAGKSTTFGLLLGQIRPTRGDAFIRGISVRKDRSRALQGVGAIYEAAAFYDYLNGWDNLRALAACSAPASATDDEISEVVRFVGLDDRIRDPVRAYSHGMRQRLALAQALLPRPDLVLLDEPAEGLDPEGIHAMRKLILRLNQERGLTVLLSTHLLSEVEHLCSDLAILHQGRLVYQGAWSRLARQTERFRLGVDNWEATKPILKRCGAIATEEFVIKLSESSEIAEVIAELVRHGIRIHSVEPLHPTLEEFYLETIAEK
ncbi:MAG: ABC transporter ATP-binding protein [Verrucomicrobiae bacterium]|nr:ABC transporter ATP-binding protein [Verrucomicrobiae bacterium]